MTPIFYRKAGGKKVQKIQKAVLLNKCDPGKASRAFVLVGTRHQKDVAAKRPGSLALARARQVGENF